MECAICLAVPQNPEKVNCCKGLFCSDCLLTWSQVRNCCPLCIKPFSGHAINNLQNQHQVVEFDNGSLIFENQVKEVHQRARHLEKIIANKRQLSRNHKSNFPKSHLEFIETQMNLNYDNLDMLERAVGTNDRVTAATYLQMVMEVIFNIEAALEGNITFEYFDLEFQEDEQFYEEDYDSEEEYGYKRIQRKQKGRVSKKKMQQQPIVKKQMC